jgi:hypothetical protein
MQFERPEIKNKNILNRIKVDVIVKHRKMIHLLLFEQANKVWNRINKYVIVFYKKKLWKIGEEAPICIYAHPFVD